MVIAQAKLVDLTVIRWYDCVSRCVRKAFCSEKQATTHALCERK